MKAAEVWWISDVSVLFFIYLYTNTFLNEACFDLNEVVSSSAASLESSMQADKTRECCKTTFSKRVFVLVVTFHTFCTFRTPAWLPIPHRPSILDKWNAFGAVYGVPRHCSFKGTERQWLITVLTSFQRLLGETTRLTTPATSWQFR